MCKIEDATTSGSSALFLSFFIFFYYKYSSGFWASRENCDTMMSGRAPSDVVCRHFFLRATPFLGV